MELGRLRGLCHCRLLGAVGVGELGRQRHKAAIYGVFKKIAFVFVYSHP
jgi:hypothetical protein